MPKLNKEIISTFYTYKNYVDIFNQQVNISDVNSLSENDKKFYEYRKLNLQRSSRIEKTFEPADKTKDTFSKINKASRWIVITESWCGDSAQSLPVVARLAELSKLIDFKIVLRDSNLEFMDMYLTNGGRSIPKLVVFDENDNELFNWGPRPAEAQKLFTELKKNGTEVSEIHKEIQLWYSKDKGSEVEKEIVNFVKQFLV